MPRAISSFMLGVGIAASLLNAIAVYVYHDVDRDRIGQWNRAYIELTEEFFVWVLILGLFVWLVTFLGRVAFRLQNASPRPKLAFILGLEVSIFQYPVDFACRSFFPRFAGAALTVYTIACILVCSGILLRDNFKHLKPPTPSI